MYKSLYISVTVIDHHHHHHCWQRLSFMKGFIIKAFFCKLFILLYVNIILLYYINIVLFYVYVSSTFYIMACILINRSINKSINQSINNQLVSLLKAHIKTCTHQNYINRTRIFQCYNFVPVINVCASFSSIIHYLMLNVMHNVF